MQTCDCRIFCIFQKVCFYYLFLLGFVTSTIWLPTVCHHPCIRTPVEWDGLVGFVQFGTIFPPHIWCLCGPHIFYMLHKTDVPSQLGHKIVSWYTDGCSDCFVPPVVWLRFSVSNLSVCVCMHMYMLGMPSDAFCSQLTVKFSSLPKRLAAKNVSEMTYFVSFGS